MDGFVWSLIEFSPSSKKMQDGRGNLQAYIDFGFISLEYNNRGTPDTLAYAYNDW